MAKNGYIGRIKSGGQQVVKAPNIKRSENKSSVHSGSDLRTGSGK